MRIGLDYPELLHGDLIGSTGWLTDAAGQVTERLSYTAFGEPVTQDGVGYPPAASDTRYGYGGAWGYETGLLDLAGADANLPPVRLLHVGYRWYQPDIGRFVQRDPIGIQGGMNVYGYVSAGPCGAVDPTGCDRWIINKWGHSAIIYGPVDGQYFQLEMGPWRYWDGWWSLPKTAFQNAVNYVGCATVGGFGRVYKREVDRPGGPPTFPTAPEEDAVLHGKYHDGDCVYYDLWWRNCNHYEAGNQGDGTGH